LGELPRSEFIGEAAKLFGLGGVITGKATSARSMDTLKIGAFPKGVFQMIGRITRSLPLLTVLVAAVTVLNAQDGGQAAQGQQAPYQGQSHPPSDDVIETSTIPEAKPPAGKPLEAQPAPAPQAVQQSAPAPAAAQYEPPPVVVAPPQSYTAAANEDGTDFGIVHVGPAVAPPPPYALISRPARSDADGDIVSYHPARPGELSEGTTIRVRLLDRLSTAETETGQAFHSRVATDVLQGGQVIIPAGAEIDGTVVEVSSGHVGGHGTMRLAPESITLPNGTRFHLHAEVADAPGSNTHVVGEGIIRPDTRYRRDGIEYGAAVGTGAVTGAIVAGPVGALTGSLIGAGAITVHLMVDHPQATLDSGTSLIFMLTDALYLAPERMSGN
jgi:hypothetical protein